VQELPSPPALAPERDTEPAIPTPAAITVIVSPTITQEKKEDERETAPTFDELRDQTHTNQPDRAQMELPPLVAESPSPSMDDSPGSSAPSCDALEVKAEPGTSPSPEPSPEEKFSALVPPAAVEAGSSTPKMKCYNGKGRRHTDEQIDEILDEYLQYGHLPKYVSDRQRRSYRRHKRLELRRMYLEQAGLIASLSGIEESGNNVSDLAR
jgi:hypothetical protein